MKMPVLSAACGGLLLSGSQTESFSTSNSGYSIAHNNKPHNQGCALNQAPLPGLVERTDCMRQANRAGQTSLGVLRPISTRLQASNSEDIQIKPSLAENKAFLETLLPVDQFMGNEFVRDLPKPINPLKHNYFFRHSIKGLSVSPHWPSRVRSLADKGPFPVQRTAVDVTLSSGKKLTAVVDFPTQRERDSHKKLPVIFYEPPAFIGCVKLPQNKVFFDAQIGLPFMKHMASYGMVGITLMQPGSVLLDDVASLNHEQDAQELNEAIDMLSAEGAFQGLGLPAVDNKKIGLIAYSRGAKIALGAAAKRIEQNRQAHNDARVVTIAKDPVNTGGVPPFILKMISPSIQKLIPETYHAWQQSSHRFPVAPLPDSPEGETFPINHVTDPVLIFEGQLNWVNPDPLYSAKVFFEALPKDSEDKNLLVKVKGPHESWVNDYNIKGDSMALMTAFLLTHLDGRSEFNRYLQPQEVIKAENGTFESVRSGN